MTMSAYLLYAVTVLIWGSTWLGIKFQLGEVDPLVSVLYRFGLSAVVLFAWCVLSRSRLRLPAKEHGFMMLQGVCLFSINYWLVYWSEVYLTSGIVAVIFSSLVFMNIFNSRVFLNRRFVPKVLLGGVLGMLGVGLLFFPELGQLSLHDEAMIGFLFGVLATYIASLGNIIATRNTATGLAVMSINAWCMLYGTLLLLVLALITGAEFRYPKEPDYTISLLYLALFGTVIAFGVYMRLLAMIGPNRAAYSSMLFPVVALLLSTWFEDYHWSWPAFVGLALIAAGNILVLGPRTNESICER